MEPRFSDTSYQLLPPNASQMERDILRLPQLDGLLIPAGQQLPAADTTLPDSWLPWLMIEYGLAELHPFFNDPRVLIREGVQFWRCRGTIESMNTVFRWLGLGRASVWEPTTPGVHYAEWQVNLGERAGLLSTVCPLVKLANLAQPAHARFRRVFNDEWNDHVFSWDDKLSGGTGLLSAYSGVVTTQGAVCGYSGGETLVISLGGRQGVVGSAEMCMQVDHVSDRISTASTRSALWGRLSEDWPAPGAFYPESSRVTVGCEREYGTTTRAVGQWGQAVFDAATGWDGAGKGFVVSGHIRETV